MNDDLNEYRLDKTAFSVARLEDEPDERAYWRSKTPEERLRAAEFLRRQLYGEAALHPMQKVFEVVEFRPR